MPGGGVALVQAGKTAFDKLDLPGDEATGVNIVKVALDAPLRQIAVNAGLEGGVVVEKVRGLKPGHGLDAATGEYVDMLKAGIIDPAKVTRSALQNAASIAALFLTTEAVVADKPEKEKAPADAAVAAGTWTSKSTANVSRKAGRARGPPFHVHRYGCREQIPGTVPAMIGDAHPRPAREDTRRRRPQRPAVGAAPAGRLRLRRARPRPGPVRGPACTPTSPAARRRGGRAVLVGLRAQPLGRRRSPRRWSRSTRYEPMVARYPDHLALATTAEEVEPRTAPAAGSPA